MSPSGSYTIKDVRANHKVIVKFYKKSVLVPGFYFAEGSCRPGFERKDKRTLPL